MPSMHWTGKEAAANAERNTPIRALVPEVAGTVATPAQGNMLVRGDNLLGLKALQPFYNGKAKLVYMDPPYNTGNQTWIYDDAMNAEETRRWIGQVIGPDHMERSDAWLCMMLPRIKAAKKLLRRDGVLAVSIDDAEYAHLMLLLEAEFGPKNHIGTIIWKTKSAANDAKHVSAVHEYIVLFAKDHEHLRVVEPQWRVAKEHADRMLAYASELMAEGCLSHEERAVRMKEWQANEIAEISSGLLADDPSLQPRDAAKEAKRIWGGLKNYKHFDSRGLYYAAAVSWPNNSGGPTYDVLHPVTNKPCPVPPTGWRWTEDRMKSAIAEDRIHFGPDHTTGALQKIYAEDTLQVVQNSVVDYPGRAGSELLDAVLGQRAGFPYPKPVILMRRIIELVTQPGDLIVDPFCGSGSTCHAVLQLNAEARAAGQSERRFISIEMEDEVAETVTKPRLDRVIAGYTTPKGKQIAGLGGEYTVWQVGPELLDDADMLTDDVDYTTLASLVGAHHAGGAGATYDPAGPIVAEDERTCVAVLTHHHRKMVNMHDLNGFAQERPNKKTFVYADHVAIDDDAQVPSNVVLKEVPYDMPLRRTMV